MSRARTHGPWKVLLLGDSSVGKSSLITRLMDDQFRFNRPPTIGVDFRLHVLNVGGERCKLQVWDTAGQEKFGSITKGSLRNVHAILVVFDASCQDHNLVNWLEVVHGFATGPREWQEDAEPLVAIVANKTDLEAQADLPSAKALADERGLAFFKTSARSGEGVHALFEHVAGEVLELDRAVRRKSADLQPTVQVQAETPAKERCAGCVGSLLKPSKRRFESF